MKPTLPQIRGGLRCLVAAFASFLAFHAFAISLAQAQRSAPAADGLHYYFPPMASSAPQLVATEVCVYGATPGGVTAAIQASRMGKKAVLIELGRHIGGMTAGGLSDTDGGDKSITGGIAAEFYESVPHPLPLAYRAIVPRESECANLAVVFCLSASHTGLSTLRMEPVLMITGQSAATASCMAIDAGCSMQELDYPKLRAKILAEGQILTPPPGQPKADPAPRLRLEGIVVDGEAAQFTGAWVRSALLPPLVGDAYGYVTIDAVQFLPVKGE